MFTARAHVWMAAAILVIASYPIAFGQTSSKPSSKPSTSGQSFPKPSNGSTATQSSPAYCNPGDGLGIQACTPTRAVTTAMTPGAAAKGANGSSGAGTFQSLLRGTLNSMSNLANQGSMNAPCYWSSRWDGLNPELQGRLRQHQTVDMVIAGYGGPEEVIAYAQNSGNLEREFAALQGQGLGTEADFKMMADGFIDIAKCRLGQPSQQLTTPTLIDPNAFKQGGDDSIDKSVDDLLRAHDVTDCDSALQYVGDVNGLQKDLDVAVAQQRAHEAGLDRVQTVKDDLLKDSWWATSKGPVVAAQIKVVCDEVQDWVSIVDPEEAKLSQGKDALLKSLKVASSMIKAAYESRESVTAAVKAAKDAEAKELGDIAAEDLADAIKMGPAYGTYKALQDSQEYVNTLNDASDARAVVQDQLQKLDQQIAKARSQVSIDAQKQTVLEALRQDVMNACVQNPVHINRP